jgi:hypothetical protein
MSRESGMIASGSLKFPAECLVEDGRKEGVEFR